MCLRNCHVVAHLCICYFIFLLTFKEIPKIQFVHKWKKKTIKKAGQMFSATSHYTEIVIRDMSTM